MDTNVSRTIIQLNSEEFRTLTTEVTETVAVNTSLKQMKKPFTVAVLWKIQNNKKRYAAAGRKLFCM